MKLLDIALKDMLRSFRSLFAVGMMVVAPLLIAGLIYAAFGGMSQGRPDLPTVRVGLADLDVPPADAPVDLGQTIADMFTDPSVQDWLTVTQYPDELAARAALNRQEVAAVVIVPADFTASFLTETGEQGSPHAPLRAPVRIVQDPTLSIGPLVVRNMISALLEGLSSSKIALEVTTERHTANGLAPDMAAWGPAFAGYQAWYIEFQRAMFHKPDEAALRITPPAAQEEATNAMQQLMGIIMAGQMIFFAFYTGAYSMMSILNEQEEGTLARLFTTPTNRTLILGGKFLAVFFTVILQGLVLMTVARLAFGVHWGHPASVALALVGQVVTASGLGVLLIALVKNTQQGGPVLGGGLTALGMLGGLFTVSVPNMPALFNTLSLFTPHGWVLKSWKLAMAGESPLELLVPFAIALIIGSAMFALGAALFRRRFA